MGKSTELSFLIVPRLLVVNDAKETRSSLRCLDRISIQVGVGSAAARTCSSRSMCMRKESTGLRKFDRASNLTYS